MSVFAASESVNGSEVSVVIPIYNSEQWIEDTLQSVLQQEVRVGVFDVIVVDDGSSDQSLVRAERVLSRSGFSYQIVRQRNAGASAARNAGWRRSQARWIQFLDSDDLLAPHKLRLHLAAAGENPDAAVIYSQWAHLTGKGGAWRVEENFGTCLGADPCSDLLRSDVFLATGSTLIAAEALGSVGGFNESLSVVEDVDLLQRIALQGGRFVHVHTDQPVMFYRHVPGSLSRRDPRQFALGCLAKAETADDHFRAAGEMTEERRMRLTDAYFFCARALAPLDAEEFERTVLRIEALEGEVLPAGPGALRHLSRLVGYRRAERVATQYRMWKSALSRSRA